MASRGVGWLTGRPDPVGTVVAVAGLLAAFSPTLLPRAWPAQGLICGLAAAAGYVAGTVLHELQRRLGGRRGVVPTQWQRRLAARVGLGAGAALAIAAWVRAIWPTARRRWPWRSSRPAC